MARISVVAFPNSGALYPAGEAKEQRIKTMVPARRPHALL